MKKTILISILISSLAIGCSQKRLTEKEFKTIWQEYIKSEFVEGFDEKQSTFQREQILKKVVSQYGFDITRFKAYMREHHKDKYRKVFEK